MANRLKLMNKLPWLCFWCWWWWWWLRRAYISVFYSLFSLVWFGLGLDLGLALWFVTAIAAHILAFLAQNCRGIYWVLLLRFRSWPTYLPICCAVYAANKSADMGGIGFRDNQPTDREEVTPKVSLWLLFMHMLSVSIRGKTGAKLICRMKRETRTSFRTNKLSFSAALKSIKIRISNLLWA